MDYRAAALSRLDVEEFKGCGLFALAALDHPCRLGRIVC